MRAKNAAGSAATWATTWTLIVYGHGGQPLVCLPSYNGRMRDWEAFGMVDCVADLIEAGRLTMIAVDGIDWQSWTNRDAPAEHRARRHNDYVPLHHPTRSCRWRASKPGTTAYG